MTVHVFATCFSIKLRPAFVPASACRCLSGSAPLCVSSLPSVSLDCPPREARCCRASGGSAVRRNLPIEMFRLRLSASCMRLLSTWVVALQPRIFNIFFHFHFSGHICWLAAAALESTVTRSFALLLPVAMERTPSQRQRLLPSDFSEDSSSWWLTA